MLLNTTAHTHTRCSPQKGRCQGISPYLHRVFRGKRLQVIYKIAYEFRFLKNSAYNGSVIADRAVFVVSRLEMRHKSVELP